MATAFERTILTVELADDADYRRGLVKVAETLEATWGGRDEWQRKWNNADDLDGIGAGLVLIPMTAAANGVGPTRLLYLWIEPSATALATGVSIQTDETANTSFGLWLRAVSATQRGFLLVRGFAVTLASGAGSQNLVLRNPSATDVIVHAVYAGDEA